MSFCEERIGFNHFVLQKWQQYIYVTTRFPCTSYITMPFLHKQAIELVFLYFS